MTKDQQWIREHFEELVEKFAGRYIAVANEELLVGDSLQEVRANSRRKKSIYCLRVQQENRYFLS